MYLPLCVHPPPTPHTLQCLSQMPPFLPRVVIWPIDDILAQFMHIPGGDRLGVGQLLSEHCRHANLVGVDAWIRGDH